MPEISDYFYFMLKYHETKFWKDSIELYRIGFEVSEKLKQKKHYRFSEQIESSCGSISDNIAEGFGRGGNKELIQFLAIARGSCTEFENQIVRCEVIGVISNELKSEIVARTTDIEKQINAFINYLKSSDFRGTKFK
jgi:four helix bundle protein